MDLYDQLKAVIAMVFGVVIIFFIGKTFITQLGSETIGFGDFKIPLSWILIVVVILGLVGFIVKSKEKLGINLSNVSLETGKKKDAIEIAREFLRRQQITVPADEPIDYHYLKEEGCHRIVFKNIGILVDVGTNGQILRKESIS